MYNQSCRPRAHIHTHTSPGLTFQLLCARLICLCSCSLSCLRLCWPSPLTCSPAGPAARLLFVYYSLASTSCSPVRLAVICTHRLPLSCLFPFLLFLFVFFLVTGRPRCPLGELLGNTMSACIPASAAWPPGLRLSRAPSLVDAGRLE